MNNDFLRLTNKNEDEKNDGIFDSNDVDKIIPQNKTKVVFTLPKGDIVLTGRVFGGHLPSVKKIFIAFALILLSSCVFISLSFFFQSAAILYSSVAILSLLFPLFLYLFFYELSDKSKITILDFVSCFLFGCLAAVLSKIFQEKIPVLTGNSIWLADFLSSIFNDILLLALSVAIVMFKKKDDLKTSAYLVVFMFIGYIFIKTVSELGSDIFLILNSPQRNELHHSLQNQFGENDLYLNIISVFLYKGLFKPFIFTTWCFVYAWLVGLLSLPVKIKQNSDVFAPLAIVLQFIFHVLLSINWSFVALNAVIAIISSVLFSAFAIRIIGELNRL